MRVVATDDGEVRSHEEAAAVLRYAVPGAVVTVRRPRLKTLHERTSERARVYEIALPQLTRQPVVAVGSYALPLPAADLAAHARAEVEKRLAHHR